MDFVYCLAGIRRSALVIDVEAVRGDPERHDFCAEFPENIRRSSVRRSICAVEDNPQTVQSKVLRESGFDELNIAPEPVIDPARSPDFRRARKLVLLANIGFNGKLHIVLQLATVRTKKLYSIVVMRVVRRRYHHAKVGSHGTSQQSYARRRHWPKQKHVHPGCGQPCRESIFDHVA